MISDKRVVISTMRQYDGAVYLSLITYHSPPILQVWYNRYIDTSYDSRGDDAGNIGS